MKKYITEPDTLKLIDFKRKQQGITNEMDRNNWLPEFR